jgi:hypothetical protein
MVWFAEATGQSEQGGSSMDLFDDSIDTSWLDDIVEDEI